MEFVRYEEKGPIGIITIDRPKALNALNSQVFSDLDAALDLVGENIRCLILTGAGEKSFVAGADIGEMSGLNKEQGREFCENGHRVVRRYETFEIPIIAAVNGFALGGGCELAMACDIRIASDNALFGQPEAGLGIPPGAGGTQRLPRIVGMGIAKELVYTCDRIKAQKALEIGLVNAVYPQAELMAEAMKLAEKIAANAPIAVRVCKKAINDGMQVDIETAIDIEIDAFVDCIATEDQKMAMTAFMEKREHGPFQNK